VSNHPFGFIEHHFPEWAAIGTETPEGSRDFLTGQEPTEKEFDYLFDQIHKFADALCTAVRDYVMPQRFFPESISLVGTDCGSEDVLTTADSRRLSVIKLAAASYEQCRVTARVLKDNTISTPEATKVVLYWSTAATSAKTAELRVKYVALGAGDVVTGSASTISKQASDSAVQNGLVVTTVELPVLTLGDLLLLEIGHDGTADDIDNDLCIHLIEVI